MMMRVSSMSVAFGGLFSHLNLYGEGASTTPTISKPLQVQQLQDGAALSDQTLMLCRKITDHAQLKTVRDYLRQKMRTQMTKANSGSQDRLSQALSLAMLMEDKPKFMDAVRQSPQWFRDAMTVKEAAQVFVFSPNLHRDFGLSFSTLGWEFLTTHPLNAKNYGLDCTA